MLFIYHNYDRITTEETVSIEDVTVKTEDLGYVKMLDGNLNYKINFNKLGQEFIFSFDLKNDNTFDMNVKKINITGVSDWVDYRIYDMNGNSIGDNLVIKKNTKQKVYVALKYTKNIDTVEDKTCKMGISLKVSMI